MHAIGAHVDQGILGEIPEVRNYQDVGVITWLNLPTAGIVSAAKQDFFLTMLTNTCQMFSKNGAAFIVHGNRAAQAAHARTVALAR